MLEDHIAKYHTFKPEGRISKAQQRVLKILADPAYSCKAKQRESAALTYEANRRSFLLEPEVAQLETEVVRDKLTHAWEFGKENYQHGNITDEYLLHLNYLIDSTHASTRTFSFAGEDYRKDNIQVTGHDAVKPVKGQRVSEEMYNLMEYLNDENLNAVTRAINAHMHIARIHPFYEGNGRTSRMLMNIMLQQNGMPAVTIPKNERETYMGILRGAMRGYNSRMESSNPGDSGSETLFINYHLDKMSTFLDNLAENLKNHRGYAINTENFEPGQVMTAKHEIQNAFRSRGDNGTCRLIDSRHLHVTGNIGEKTLSGIMERSAGRRGKFDVLPVKPSEDDLKCEE